MNIPTFIIHLYICTRSDLLINATVTHAVGSQKSSIQTRKLRIRGRMKHQKFFSIFSFLTPSLTRSEVTSCARNTNQSNYAWKESSKHGIYVTNIHPNSKVSVNRADGWPNEGIKQDSMLSNLIVSSKAYPNLSHLAMTTEHGTGW